MTRSIALARVRGARLAAAGAAGALVLSAGAAYASPATAPLPTDKVDCVTVDPQTGSCQVVGVVYAMAQVGGTTYIGGSFKSVSGTARANVAAIGADGKLVPSWNPTTDGTVYALTPSADGSTIFVGGSFAKVGGQPRAGLAAVSADTGSLRSFSTTTEGSVRSLATGPGNRLYVGGSFTRIGGKSVPRLASVDQDTGVVDTAFKPAPGGTVRALALPDDQSKLYAVGSFTSIGGVGRPGVAELSPTSGAVSSFAPTDGGVGISVDVTPAGRLFFSVTNNRVWAYDTGSDNTPEYRVRTGGDVQAIYATNTEVYVGGHFQKFPESGAARMHMASFLPQDGTITAWNPGVNGSYGPWAVAPVKDSTGRDVALSIGGDFTMVNKVSRRGYARFGF